MKEDWVIRQATAGDLAFIYATWTKSYRYGSTIGKSCRNSIYYEYYHRIIDWILGRPDTVVNLAVKSDEPNVIFGYLISQPGVIHYAFTKECFTRMGIARSLFSQAKAPRFYTHRTFSMKAILEKYPDALIYNPFILFNNGGK